MNVILTFTAASYAKSGCNENLGVVWHTATSLGFALSTIDMNAGIGRCREQDPTKPSHDVKRRQQLCVDLPDDSLHGCRQWSVPGEGALGHGLINLPEGPFGVAQLRAGGRQVQQSVAARRQVCSGLPDRSGLVDGCVVENHDVQLSRSSRQELICRNGVDGLWHVVRFHDRQISGARCQPGHAALWGVVPCLVSSLRCQPASQHRVKFPV